MKRRRLRVFLDTSALVAGIASSKGAARAVLQLAEAGVIELYVSRQVLVEADRTVEAKLPEMTADFREFMKTLPLVYVDDPSLEEIKKRFHLIHINDAPILTAAILAGVDYLVTWDARHLIKTKIKTDTVMKIVTPGEFLFDFRSFIDEG